MNAGEGVRMFGPYMISAPQMYEDIRNSELGTRAGVYFLRCLRGEKAANEYRSVQRFLGVDSSGILYIGSGDRACDRLGTLRKALCAAAGRQEYAAVSCHGVGKRYSSHRVQELYPFKYLCVTITEVVPGEDKYSVEQRILDKYQEQFGEVPPFNERRKA